MMKFQIASVLLILAFPFTASASESTAETKFSKSIALSALKISREKETVKPKDTSAQTSMTTAVDLFGSDGRSLLPTLELGLEIDNYVIYAYPNAAPGGRELWFGLKINPSTEAGVLIGTNHLAFNPSTNVSGKDVKTESMDRLGLFVNYRTELSDLTFDLNVTPWYALSSSTYTDSSLNQRSDETGISAEVLWVWDALPNLEISSGASLAISKSHQYLKGTELQTVDWSNIGVTLAQTKLTF